jgi:hypothetical protein
VAAARGPGTRRGSCPGGRGLSAGPGPAGPAATPEPLPGLATPPSQRTGHRTACVAQLSGLTRPWGRATLGSIRVKCPVAGRRSPTVVCMVVGPVQS